MLHNFNELEPKKNRTKIINFFVRQEEILILISEILHKDNGPQGFQNSVFNFKQILPSTHNQFKYN
jgi:thiamine pyrophosphokinase